MLSRARWDKARGMRVDAPPYDVPEEWERRVRHTCGICGRRRNPFYDEPFISSHFDRETNQVVYDCGVHGGEVCGTLVDLHTGMKSFVYPSVPAPLWWALNQWHSALYWLAVYGRFLWYSLAILELRLVAFYYSRKYGGKLSWRVDES